MVKYTKLQQRYKKIVNCDISLNIVSNNLILHVQHIVNKYYDFNQIDFGYSRENRR